MSHIRNDRQAHQAISETFSINALVSIPSAEVRGHRIVGRIVSKNVRGDFIVRSGNKTFTATRDELKRVADHGRA